MTSRTSLLGLMLAAALLGHAQPKFFMPETLYAAPGVPCSVFFAKMFESVNHASYAFEALSPKGNFWADRWTWTPTAAEAGLRVPVVFNAWNDAGLVDSVTTTVVVAQAPAPTLKARKITLALFTASFSNCLFQDQLRRRMHEAGLAGYTPVGSHTGRSCSEVCDPKEGAPHDGYGGFAWGDFMTRWAMTVDEIDNLQAEAEKEQLRRFGVRLPAGQEWRHGLLKSPIVRIENGKKVVDVQYWLDKVNGGAAPDYLLIILGGNGIATIRPEKFDEALSGQVARAKELLHHIRKACPNTRIAIGQAAGGSIEQVGWGKNYGAKTSAFRGNINRIQYDRAMMRLVAESGDPNMVFVPFSHGIDPVRSFPRTEADGNALHGTEQSGFQAGDALFAWLLNDLEACAQSGK